MSAQAKNGARGSMDEGVQGPEDFLSRFPVLRSRDLDESRALVCRVYQEVKLETARGAGGFRLSMNMRPLRWLRLASTDSPVEFTTSTLAPMKIHSFDFVTSGAYGYRSAGNRFLADSKQVAVASGERPFDVVANTRSHLLSAIIDHGDMEDLVSTWIGRKPRRPIRFAHSHPYSEAKVASFASMVKFLARELNRPGGLMDAPAALASMEEAAIAAILFGLESNLREEWEVPAPDAGSGLVRRLEDYLAAHAADPIDMATVARETGYSARSIYRAFRRYRDYSPMEFLRTVRIRAARKRLLAGRPNDNVTSIALDCGFPHLGRFSQEYSKRFAETPSETLRRSRPPGR